MSVLKIFAGVQNARKFIPSLGEVCVWVFFYTFKLSRRKIVLITLLIKGFSRWAAIYTRGHTQAIDQMLSVISLCLFSVQCECYLPYWEMRIFLLSTEKWGFVEGGCLFGKCGKCVFLHFIHR